MVGLAGLGQPLLETPELQNLAWKRSSWSAALVLLDLVRRHMPQPRTALEAVTGIAFCFPCVQLTAIMMVDASKIYDSIYLNGVGDDDYRKRLKVYFAGLIMFLIGDFLWVSSKGLRTCVVKGAL